MAYLWHLYYLFEKGLVAVNKFLDTGNTSMADSFCASWSCAVPIQCFLRFHDCFETLGCLELESGYIYLPTTFLTTYLVGSDFEIQPLFSAEKGNINIRGYRSFR